MTKKTILFVDDEQRILDGLRRMLRPMRHEWRVALAAGGEEALEKLERADFDVIVSDMRMPGMDGAALLTEVQARYPHIVRIVLSGYAEVSQAVRAVGVAHQFLSKPCDSERLRQIIGRALSLR
ncbi:MAG: response regulator, partial [Proteobacteria bacterium]|nr:response regulator [Pseudomonadota bacterium]